MTHSQCNKTQGSTAGAKQLSREGKWRGGGANVPPGWTLITDLHLPFVSVMQNENKYLFMALVSERKEKSTTTAIHTHVLYTY